MRLQVLSIAAASLSTALTIIAASPAAKKSHASASTAKKTGAKSRGKNAAKTVARARVTQQQPTPDRYRQIQQALGDKGYFSGTPDGNWGASSQEALKRFQHDQNLEEDGKLDSLSLIALGLGPNRTAVAAVREKPDSETVEPKP